MKSSAGGGGAPRRLSSTPALLLSLCLVLNAGVLYHSTSCAHRVQLHIVGRRGGAAASNRTTARGGHRDDAAAATKQQPQQAGLRLNIPAWLQFAASDAAQHGLSITEACSAALGDGFLQRFSSTWGTLCGSNDAGATQGRGSSSVECSAYPVEGLGLACSSRRLVVNASTFMGPKVPYGEQEHVKYMPKGAAGSVGLGCHMVLQGNDSLPGRRTVWESGAGANLVKEQLPWFKLAATQLAVPDTQRLCDMSRGAHQVVQHPVLFVSRLDTTNPYHHTQTLVQAFLTLAVVNDTATLPSLQVVLADHFDPGPFTDIWARLSAPWPVLSLDSPHFTANQPTCIMRGIHSHYVGPGRAFLGYEGIGIPKTCPSTVLMAFAHWQRYLFRDMLAAHEQQEYQMLEAPTALRASAGPLLSSSSNNSSSSSSHHRLNVVWLSRSWFSKSMKAGGGLTGWQASRDLAQQQESDIIRALQQAVLDWNSEACAPPVFGWWQRPHDVPPPSGCRPTNVSFDFQSVELSVEALYPEQVLLLTRTAVLVGIHGAALTNQIWMRPHRGAVVEFGAGGNFHYSNMAHMLGHRHFRADAVASQLADAVRRAMEHVSGKY